MNKVFAITALLSAIPAVSQPAKRIEVPSHFTADQVYVRLTTEAGRPLELYTDSGGGSLILSKEAANRLGLRLSAVEDKDALSEFGNNSFVADAPRLREGLPPLPTQAYVVPHARQMTAFPEQADGVVGAAYFAGGIWTWDYPKHHLWKEDSTWQPSRLAHTVPIGFKTEPDGSRPTSFARIGVEIDGQILEMLLDTGAETFLTTAAQRICDDNVPALRSTSMIQSSFFDQWRIRHPDWRFLPNAEIGTGADMLLVPDGKIAGFDTGPIWFTRRPDRNYTEFMSSMMDRPVSGSIGGNALHRFQMTVDFVHNRASFNVTSPKDR